MSNLSDIITGGGSGVFNLLNTGTATIINPQNISYTPTNVNLFSGYITANLGTGGNFGQLGQGFTLPLNSTITTIELLAGIFDFADGTNTSPPGDLIVDFYTRDPNDNNQPGSLVTSSSPFTAADVFPPTAIGFGAEDFVTFPIEVSLPAGEYFFVVRWAAETFTRLFIYGSDDPPYNEPSLSGNGTTWSNPPENMYFVMNFSRSLSFTSDLIPVSYTHLTLPTICSV